MATTSERAMVPMRQQSPQRLISDTELERALDWLRDHAEDIGRAKERVIKAGHMLKHIEALETKMSQEKSVEARKADARCSLRYVAAMEEDAVAAGEYEKMRSLREAAALKIEAWRTESSNYRAMRI